MGAFPVPGPPIGGLGELIRGLGESIQVLGQPLRGLGESIRDLGEPIPGLGDSIRDLGKPMGDLGVQFLALGKPVAVLIYASAGPELLFLVGERRPGSEERRAKLLSARGDP